MAPVRDDAFADAFTHAPIPMGIFDADGALQANAALDAMLAGRFGEPLARVIEQVATRALDRAPRRRVERRLRDESGRTAWVQLSLAVLDDDGDGSRRVLLQAVDVTARREREERLQALAEREPLTGLWNRRRFEQELARQLARCRRFGDRATLVVLDVDCLKQVNDTHGHKAGDAVIRHVARALEARVRASDAVARIGGDEFAVLLAGTWGEEAARTAAQLCDEVAATPVTVGRATIEAAVSAGLAELTDATVDEDAAFALADAALYRAKAEGRGRAENAPDIGP
jgi:diguanylate cyclase (GGDEF)-like protein/PAS domain S-box-containing protein